VVGTPGLLVRHTLVHPDGRRLHVYGDLRGQLDDRVPPTGGTGPAHLHQRYDALTDAWVAISPERNTRPSDAPDPAANGGGGPCPLCPGGPEVPFSYQAAVFDNRFPTFTPQAPPISDDPRVAPSSGRCEVVLYTEAHRGSLATLPPDDLGRVLAVWRDRSAALWADPGHAFVMVFENRGEAVGATLDHPHGQIYAFPRVPPLIADRVAVLAAHRAREGACLTCALLAQDDREPAREVARNASFTVTVPFAARWPFEVQVRARRHGLGRLADLAPGERSDLAAALADVVARYDGLYGFPLSYLMVVEEAPAGAGDWHLGVAFLPPHRTATKLKVRASVETATGLFINDTLPETSAARLRAVPVLSPRTGIRVPDVVPSRSTRTTTKEPR
jgi:UDPglucose--hexose-1-phosphate uridylyltransferase